MANEIKYWDNGFPYPDIDGVTGVNEMSFWDKGFPFQFLNPPSAPSGGLIKTINGLTLSSVKTINGLSLSSVKTFNGLTNI